MNRLDPLYVAFVPSRKPRKSRKVVRRRKVTSSPLLTKGKVPSVRSTPKGGLADAIKKASAYIDKAYQYGHHAIKMRDAILENKDSAIRAMRQAGDMTTHINDMIDKIGKVGIHDFLSSQVGNGFGAGKGGVLHSSKQFMTEDGEVGVRDSYAGMSKEMLAGKEVIHMGFRQSLKCLKDSSMVAASKMFPSTKLITSEHVRTIRGQMYFNSSFNTKGLCFYGPEFPTFSDAEDNPRPEPQLTQVGVYPLAFTTEDYYNVFASANNFGSLPSMFDFSNYQSSAITDLYMPIQSMHLVTNIFNSNTFYHARVKVYLLQARVPAGGGQGTTVQPCRAWLGNNGSSGYASYNVDNPGNQPENCMYNNWFLYDTDEVLANEVYRNEASMYLQCRPSMSEQFKYGWKIVDVKTADIPPASTLTYHLEKEIGKPTSFRDIQLKRHRKVAVDAGDYALMIEFQTKEMGLSVPFETDDLRSQNSPTTFNNPIVGIPPCRIRVDYLKYAYCTANALNKVITPGLTPDQEPIQPLDPNQTTWLYQKNDAPSVDMEQPTLPYTRYTKTEQQFYFTCPVYSDETQQSAGPASVDA